MQDFCGRPKSPVLPRLKHRRPRSMHNVSTAFPQSLDEIFLDSQSPVELASLRSCWRRCGGGAKCDYRGVQFDSRRPRRDGRVPIPPWSSKSFVLDNSSGLAEAMLGSSAIVRGTVPSGELWGHPGPQPVGNSSGLLWGAIRPLRALAGPALHRDGHGFSHRGKRVDHHPGPARRPSAVLHRGHSLLAVGDEKRTRRLAAAAQRTLPTHSGNDPGGLSPVARRMARKGER